MTAYLYYDIIVSICKINGSAGFRKTVTTAGTGCVPSVLLFIPETLINAAHAALEPGVSEEKSEEPGKANLKYGDSITEIPAKYKSVRRKTQMMRKKWHKLAMLVISVLLVAGMMPVMAFADESGNAAKVGTVEYATLDEAVAAAEDGDTITILKDCSTSGLNLNKALTINGENKTITFADKGIALRGKSLTFNDSNIIMNGIGSTPSAEWSWMAICASKDASLNLNSSTMTMDGTGTSDKTHAVYFCSNNQLNLDNSTLKITSYAQDALEWDGGDGGYNINIVNGSKFISDHNRSGFTGTFTAKIEDSTVDVINSTGNGSNGSHFEIKNSTVKFNDNASHGLSAGRLTIDNSKVYALRNGANGVHAASQLTVKNKSLLDIEGNKCSLSSKWTKPGALYVGGTDSEIDSSCNVTIKDNMGSGIYVKERASLEMQAGSVTGNTAEKLLFGGGVNNNGTFIMGDAVRIYNNQADSAGDDVYASENAVTSLVDETKDMKLTFTVRCDGTHLINGWYDDSEQARWNVHTEDESLLHYEKQDNLKLEGTAALKAAHDKASVTPTDPTTPTQPTDKTAGSETKTGDNRQLGLCIALALASAIGLTGVLIVSRRKRA